MLETKPPRGQVAASYSVSPNPFHNASLTMCRIPCHHFVLLHCPTRSQPVAQAHQIQRLLLTPYYSRVSCQLEFRCACQAKPHPGVQRDRKKSQGAHNERAKNRTASATPVPLGVLFGLAALREMCPGRPAAQLPEASKTLSPLRGD